MRTPPPSTSPRRGRSLNNRALPEDRGRETKLATIARYRFTLAFENSIAHDYVSEKLYDALLAGSVPVYLGAPNVSDHVPAQGSYIDVRDFERAAALADASYLAWRSQPLEPRFLAFAEEQRQPPLCRLCRLLEAASSRARIRSTILGTRGSCPDDPL